MSGARGGSSGTSQSIVRPGVTVVACRRRGISRGDDRMLSAKLHQACAELLTRYPEKRSALLPLLHLVQEELGHLTPESMEHVARLLEMRPTDVWETASFYTMYHFRPVGRCHIEVCHNLSCTLLGAESLLDHLKGRLQIREGETTPDGRFTLGRSSWRHSPAGNFRRPTGTLLRRGRPRLDRLQPAPPKRSCTAISSIRATTAALRPISTGVATGRKQRS